MCAEMVQATLRDVDPKTQTRRIGKLQGLHYGGLGVAYHRHATKGLDAVATYDAFPGEGTARWAICSCPYGVPGDRLWVRETFAAPWGLDYKFPGGESGIFYRADNRQDFPDDGTWTPSIFMPRKLSRITLEIVNVRVERLQDISEADVIAEGVKTSIGSGMIEGEICYQFTTSSAYIRGKTGAVMAYQDLWESLNGPGSWLKNPWVWVLEFKKL